jgi:predicted NUDIX family NTP pyrophosphohydrolase
MTLQITFPINSWDGDFILVHIYSGWVGYLFPFITLPQGKKTTMRKSAGIILFRKKKSQIEVFLVHPGGPIWKKKDAGAWSIPKGEFSEDEEPLSAALREFKEETGHDLKGIPFSLNPIKQKGGKWVYAWGIEGDIDADAIISNSFKMEWPYKSGKWQTFPEVDKAAWFDIHEAKIKINPAQAVLIEDLISKIEV